MGQLGKARKAGAADAGGSSRRSSDAEDDDLELDVLVMRSGASSSVGGARAQRGGVGATHAGARSNGAAPFSAVKTLASEAPSLFSRLREPAGRQSLAFFLFGLLNNALYVVILTAALELIPKGTPTGVVAFFNIFPALVAKAVWPYVLKGEVRYARRITSCVVMNASGIVIIALLPALATRLGGIALASFSSGLGELTFLQLSTRYGVTGAGRGVGWFSSGTGAAGFVGASAWWIVRPLGVRAGLLCLIFLPFLMSIAYGLVLPSVDDVLERENDARGQYEPLFDNQADLSDDEEGNDDAQDDQGNVRRRRSHEREPRPSTSSRRSGGVVGADAVPLAISPHASAVSSVEQARDVKDDSVMLSLSDKMRLIKPMLLVFIIPLVLVYFFEYTINQGVAPTLLYPVPTADEHPLLSRVIKQLKDYYPLYQLTYQTFVFISRSSVSIFHLPAIPKRYLWLPAIVQGGLLLLLISESLHHWFRDSIARPLTIVLVCVEGLAGGSAYVSVFYQIGTDQGTEKGPDPNEQDAEQAAAAASAREARRAQEHEFRIGCVGVGDTMGILAASLVSVPLELSLCDAQVRKGYDLCKQV